MKNDKITRITKTFLMAAEALAKEKCSGRLNGTTLKRKAEQLGGYARNSILPSDYCYNYVNKARYSCRTPLFIWRAKNEYDYIGLNANYSGSLVRRTPDGSEKQVGLWTNGVLQLFEDPRV